MSSKEQGWVEIQLDKTRRLKLTSNAICSFEEATGIGVGDALTGKNGGKFSYVRGMLWACLLEDDPSLERMGSSGLKKVGDLIGMAPGENLKDQLVYVRAKVEEAATLAWSGTKKEIGVASGEGS